MTVATVIDRTGETYKNNRRATGTPVVEREELNRWIVEECRRRGYPGTFGTVVLAGFEGANVCVFGRVVHMTESAAGHIATPYAYATIAAAARPPARPPARRVARSFNLCTTSLPRSPAPPRTPVPGRSGMHTLLSPWWAVDIKRAKCWFWYTGGVG